MKQQLILLAFFFTLNLFGQKSDIEVLIDQIVENEVPENFKYYFLAPKSLEQSKIIDSLQNYQIRELLMADKDSPKDFIYTEHKETIDWRAYNLNKARYVSQDAYYNFTLQPPQIKKVKFVKFNIDDKKYDSLINNKEPYTLIVKKKWLWNKRIGNNKKLYDEVVKNWQKDNKNNPEENVYFHFSNPIFSENKKYALVTIFEQRSCDGNGFTALYRNDNETWKKIMEFNRVGSNVSRCENDIRINYE